MLLPSPAELEKIEITEWLITIKQTTTAQTQIMEQMQLMLDSQKKLADTFLGMERAVVRRLEVTTTPLFNSTSHNLAYKNPKI